LTAALGRNSAGRVVGGYVDDQDRFHGFVQRGSRVATLDVPGARGTVASKINDDGAIVGFYTDGSGTAVAQAEHGFLYDGGRFRRIDVRGAAETRPFGINDGGQIVGEHVDAAGISHGYVRGLDGAVTSFDVPGAEATLPSDIDDGGQIVGAYYDRETQVVHGFLRAIDGTITTIDAPGTGFLTQAVGINEGGQIVGYSIDDCNVVRGFVRQADGSFATVEPPGGRSNTTVQDIDDQGRLVDQYGVLFSGYVRDPRGRIATFDAPGCRDRDPGGGRQPRCDIVGTYDPDTTGNRQGFLRSDRGRYETIQVPQAASTAATGINDHDQIVGAFNATPRHHSWLLDDGRFTEIEPPGVPTGSLATDIDDGRIVGWLL
jgi:uncharacterized membrane protein